MRSSNSLWRLSNRAEAAAREIADRHYNRQKIGARQFVPPGRCLVLLDAEQTALWVTSWPLPEYVQHRWPGAWVNSLFRREAAAPAKASKLILDAVAATIWGYGEPPSLGMVTFIDRDEVRPRRDGYGKCYRIAGFEEDGETEGGVLALRMRPEKMPPAKAPHLGSLFISA